MTKKRTEQQIVDQTEALADMLMKAFHRREKADPLYNYRSSLDARAQQCWLVACQIQEMLTDTDPENAAAEVDDAPAPPPKPEPAAATAAWEPLTPEVRERLNYDDCYWVAVRGQVQPFKALYGWRKPGGRPVEYVFFTEGGFTVPCEVVTHILPFTTPEMPS